METVQIRTENAFACKSVQTPLINKPTRLLHINLLSKFTKKKCNPVDVMAGELSRHHKKKTVEIIFAAGVKVSP